MSGPPPGGPPSPPEGALPPLSSSSSGLFAVPASTPALPTMLPPLRPAPPSQSPLALSSLARPFAPAWPPPDALATLALAQRDTPRSTPSSHDSTAGRRRRRDERDERDETSSATSSKRSRRSRGARGEPSSTGSGVFSSHTKQRLDRHYRGGQCWFCPIKVVHHAHVIGALDSKNFADLKRLELLNLEALTAFENGVLLCPTCHKVYDDAYRPKLVIVPAALDFFVAVEAAWQQRPTANLRAPTAASYYAHCANSYPSSLWVGSHVAGDHTPSPFDDMAAQGGLYLGYMDEDYLNFDYPQSRSPRPWHGDPMAMVHHAISAAHRIAAPDLLPKAVWDHLRHLSALYQRGDDLMRSIHAAASTPQPPPPPLPAPATTPSSNPAGSSYAGGPSNPPNPPAPPPPQRSHNAAKRGLADDIDDAPRKRARHSSPIPPSYAVQRFLSADNDSRSELVRRSSFAVADSPPRSRPVKRARSDDLDNSRKKQRYATPPPSNTPSVPELAHMPNQAQAHLEPPGSAPRPEPDAKPSPMRSEPEPKTWRWGPDSTAQDVSERWRVLYPTLWARDCKGEWRYIGNELGEGHSNGNSYRAG